MGLTLFSIFGGSYVGGYPSVFGIKIGHHLPSWGTWRHRDLSLAVFYYGVNSRLGPERVIQHAEEAAGTRTRRTWTWASPSPPDADGLTQMPA